jgi:hypothetical protein
MIELKQILFSLSTMLRLNSLAKLLMPAYLLKEINLSFQLRRSID